MAKVFRIKQTQSRKQAWRKELNQNREKGEGNRSKGSEQRRFDHKDDHKKKRE